MFGISMTVSVGRCQLEQYMCIEDPPSFWLTGQSSGTKPFWQIIHTI